MVCLHEASGHPTKQQLERTGCDLLGHVALQQGGVAFHTAIASTTRGLGNVGKLRSA